MLYNIRRVRPCLTQEAAQVLIQALVISRLDYCNSLLAGLPACAIKPLQLIQNAAARLVFNFPKFSHVTPLLRSLHWLPVEARIRYKTMVLAYGAVRGTAPPYLQALIRPYTQTRALRSSTSGLLASLPLRKYSSRSAQSKLFAALAPQWWNKLPHDASVNVVTAPEDSADPKQRRGSRVYQIFPCPLTPMDIESESESFAEDPIHCRGRLPSIVVQTDEASEIRELLCSQGAEEEKEDPYNKQSLPQTESCISGDNKEDMVVPQGRRKSSITVQSLSVARLTPPHSTLHETAPPKPEEMSQ
ncbi:uncharacterized protein [Salvelinus alpinus]|uniref:uncharacterized protein n=1 Tax=Salvelinus alpinus TaxID=8036 RepID=UPI0039FC62A3